MKSMSVFAARLLAAAVLILPFIVSAQDSNTESVPEVRVTATSWKTAEPCPVCLVAPGVLRFERSEPTKEPLAIDVATDGTATAGLDYRELPRRVEIPAGASFVEVLLAPLDDEIVEGPEVVRVRILPRPDAYRTRPHQSEALVVIGDIEFGAIDIPQARLDVINPRDGEQVGRDTILKIEAIVVWTESEVMRPIEFFAGDEFLGRSMGIPLLRPPIACLPSVQTIHWTNPPAGEHVLTAQVELTHEEYLHSPPVRIIVGEGEPELPVVSIETTWPIAEESSHPYRRIPFVGRLTIQRTGPTDHSLPVFLHYSGTADPKDIEPAPPWMVSIPAGASSAEVLIHARPDEMEEGIETLVVALANCPPKTDPPLGVPCYAFDIDPARSSATIFLRDDGVTRAELTITHPEDGAIFKAGTSILIEAMAIDLEGYISRVEFFDGDRFIGESEIVFVRAPEPGTPIHHPFEWNGAEPGAHALTARAVVADDLKIVSEPVRIEVEGGGNHPPQIALVQPEPGTVVPPLTPIELVAEATDPDGYVRKVAFLANGRQIGEVGWERDHRPSPDEPQRFVFLWRYPMPGPQTLTARAMDIAGGIAESDPVEIRVASPVDLPVVMVTAKDPFAVEPSANAEADAATFFLRRFGGLDRELVVRYLLRGSASNGTDYEMLSGAVRFAANESSATVVIQPLADDAPEGVETVILHLEEHGSNDTGTTDPSTAPSYRIGYRGRAVAVIQDQRWNRETDRARCLPVGDGFMHICFGTEDGRLYRLEASADMRRWETLFRAVPIDGAIHGVDEESGEFPRRFYRIVPEPEVVAP